MKVRGSIPGRGGPSPGPRGTTLSLRERDYTLTRVLGDRPVLAPARRDCGGQSLSLRAGSPNLTLQGRRAMADEVRSPDSHEWSVIEQDHANLTPEVLSRRLLGGYVHPWARVLLRLTTDSTDILDLGSGTGRSCAILSGRGKRTTLLDWSEENLKFSRKLFQLVGEQGRFVQHDITRELPFDDDAFDTTLCWSVLQFFSDEQIARIVKEASRVSRKRVIIAAPDAFCVGYGIGKWYAKRKGRWAWGDERRFTSLKPYLRAAGSSRVRQFSVSAKHGLSFLTMPGGGLVRRSLTFVLRLKDDSRAVMLRQGYMLVGVGEEPNARSEGT